MPKAFTDCVKKKGKVRTIVLPGGKYKHVCTINNKSYYGEVKIKIKHNNESKHA